jgi:molecular chaperone DnaJ
VQTACKKCSGRGKERKSRKIEVQIPAGIEHGTKLLIHGEGETGERGVQSGDLYVHIGVEKDKIFDRKGSDILMTAELDIAMATLGGIINIETLDGSTDIEIKPGTQSGTIQRVKGAGIQHMGGSGRRGDQLVELNIITPRKLDERQTQLLQELAESFGLKRVGKGSGNRHGFFGRLKGAFNNEEHNP